jgi:hypothetical protein
VLALTLTRFNKATGLTLLSVDRRFILRSFGLAPLLLGGAPSWGKCRDLESCREEGERKIEVQEKEAGPIVNLGKGVRYREKRIGSGDVAFLPGDVGELTYIVTNTGGNYLWSLGRGIEPGQNDITERLRIILGHHDVPVAVEMALEVI